MTNYDDLRKLADVARRTGLEMLAEALGSDKPRQVVDREQRKRWLEFRAAMSPDVTLGLLDALKVAREQVAQLREVLQTALSEGIDSWKVQEALAATESKAKEGG